MKELHGKLFKIMGAIDYIQKDKTNTFHHYNYASERVIKEVVRKELKANKVLFIIDVIEQELDGNRTLAKFEYQFIDIENSQTLKGTFCGQGEDKLDKGIYKAITGAIKYILTSTFLIPTGDDPEEAKLDEEAERDIKKSIKACRDTTILTELYNSLTDEQKEEYKDEFTKRKQQLTK